MSQDSIVGRDESGRVATARARVLRRGLLALLAIVPAACGPERDTFAPACPVPGLMKPLDVLTRSRGGSPDIRDLAVQARIADVPGRCEPGENKSLVNVTAQIVVEATRGPGMAGDTAQLPVFLAVLRGDAVLDKKSIDLTVAFPRNVDSVRVASQEVNMVLPVSPTQSAATYSIVAGFQLTPEEIAAARRAAGR